jgi:hypothetical protein
MGSESSGAQVTVLHDRFLLLLLAANALVWGTILYRAATVGIR